MKTPISYYGGKQNLVSTLLPLIPPHRLYCEPFFGGGALFFAKPPSTVEVINDLNGEVVNFYRVAKTRFEELQREVQGTLHSRELHRKACEIYRNPGQYGEVERAWAFWTGTNQGFSYIIDGGWRYCRSVNRVAIAPRVFTSKRNGFTHEICRRLERTMIENNDAMEVIKWTDGPDAFIYCDPPYIGSDMGHYKGYTDSDYIGLLEALGSIKGKFMLSGYPSDILTDHVGRNGWRMMQVTQKLGVTNTKATNKKTKTKTEVIVMNYDINQLNGQMMLF